MAHQEALDIFAAALKKVSKTSVGRKMEHIGHPAPYADIVGMWVRNNRFLDSRGWPRVLRLEGRSGFAALVRSVTSSPNRMAYEPVAYFLSDASSTLSKILKRSKRWRGPDLFWQKTENVRISEATAKRFTSFAKERGLVFLDELDDWLEAHSERKKTGRRQQRRVGLGIFSIYSDREASDASA
jgi:hypothetical protein